MPVTVRDPPPAALAPVVAVPNAPGTPRTLRALIVWLLSFRSNSPSPWTTTVDAGLIWLLARSCASAPFTCARTPCVRIVPLLTEAAGVPLSKKAGSVPAMLPPKATLKTFAAGETTVTLMVGARAKFRAAWTWSASYVLLL